VLEMKAIKDIAAGEELYNDYGLLPRSDLLRNYGYITPRYAKYDVVDIPTSLFVEKARELFGFSGEVIQEDVSPLQPFPRTPLKHLPAPENIWLGRRSAGWLRLS
jgi:N-lysine methyltransferase SETD6